MASVVRYISKGAIVLLFAVLCSCTKYGYIDGGVPNGVHDCSMWDYFKKDSYDWDSTMIMIEHAGLKSYFDGTGEHKEITFFGLTNLSIRRYIMEVNKNLDKNDPAYLNCVTDMSPDFCKNVLLKLIVPKRLMLKDFPRGRRYETYVDEKLSYREEDGVVLSCLQGNLFAWTLRDEFSGVQDGGAVELYIASKNVTGARSERIASTDIQTNTGVVHSLNYDFRFINF